MSEPKEKKLKDSEQVNVRMGLPVLAEIDAFIANAGPTLRRTIEKASVLADGKPHGSSEKHPFLHSFIAYAVHLALNKPNVQTVGRTFGEEIEKTVREIMDRNEIAHENGEPWNVRVIGLSVLRDAGHNHNSCVRWLTENLKRLTDHYAAVGVPVEELKDWNRKQGVYKNRLKQEGQ